MAGTKQIIKDHPILNKGDEVTYLRGNDKVSEVEYKGKRIWIKNEYLWIKQK